jgi:hypothetical protein
MKRQSLLRGSCGIALLLGLIVGILTYVLEVRYQRFGLDLPGSVSRSMRPWRDASLAALCVSGISFIVACLRKRHFTMLKNDRDGRKSNRG